MKISIKKKRKTGKIEPVEVGDVAIISGRHIVASICKVTRVTATQFVAGGYRWKRQLGVGTRISRVGVTHSFDPLRIELRPSEEALARAQLEIQASRLRDFCAKTREQGVAKLQNAGVEKLEQAIEALIVVLAAVEVGE